MDNGWGIMFRLALDQWTCTKVLDLYFMSKENAGASTTKGRVMILLLLSTFQPPLRVLSATKAAGYRLQPRSNFMYS